MARLNDRKDWFELWNADKQSILETMIRNLHADLEAGYNFRGNCVQRQLNDITSYQLRYNAEMDGFKAMTEDEVNRWCFYDLKKRGAIE